MERAFLTTGEEANEGVFKSPFLFSLPTLRRGGIEEGFSLFVKGDIGEFRFL